MTDFESECYDEYDDDQCKRFNKEIIKAYRRVKAFAYGERNLFDLRRRIAEFESGLSNEGIKEKLNIFGSNFYYNYTEMIGNDLSDSICIHALPKTIAETKDVKPLSGFERPITCFKDAQYFIGMSMEAQILGMTWVAIVGSVIDSKLRDCCYGNRIQDALLNKESPYIFKPYMFQYNSWRNNGIECAISLRKQDKSALILTMDVERFFYNVDLNNGFWNEIGAIDIPDWDSGLVTRLNRIVRNIVERYSKCYHECRNDEDENMCLPLGFAPSSVLSNWYLNKLDETIVNHVRPSYYGRYVDDMFLVFPIDANTKEWLSEKDCCEMLKHLLGELIEIVPDGDGHLDKALLESGYGRQLAIKTEKLLLKMIDVHGPGCELTMIKRTLHEMSSEFRMLPEESGGFAGNECPDVFDIDGIMKPSEMGDVHVDGKKLSRYLGKQLAICGLVDPQEWNSFYKNLEKILNEQVLLENHQQWERILGILILTNDFKGVVDFVRSVLNAIDSVSIGDGENQHLNEVVKKGLCNELLVDTGRCLGPVWGRNVSVLIDELNMIMGKDLRKLRIDLCTSRLLDKHLLSVPVDSFVENGKLLLNDDMEVSLVNMKGVMGSENIEKMSFKVKDYEFHPYYIKTCEMMFYKLLESMVEHEKPEGKTESIPVFEKWKIAHDESLKINFGKSHRNEGLMEFGYSTEHEMPIVKAGNGSMDSIRIAVANMAQPSDDLFDRMNRGEYDRGMKRFKEVVKVFNEALEYESDMIVMPESSIPLEWLMLLVRRCMNNQTGLITGVEHVIGNRYVFNYTAIVLPVKDERRYRDAFLGMHLKRHYSPGEVERIRNMGYLPAIGLTMELYDWNNLWFTVFCCFELSDIQNRGRFRSLVDMMFVVECNKDVNYFGNIIDSTSRDLHCYCIQVNHSKYGDSRITEPKSTEKKDCIVIKGGMNTAVLVSKLEIGLFRHKQLYTRDKGDLKPLPPGFDEDMVRARVMGKMWNRICTPCDTKKDNDGMSE